MASNKHVLLAGVGIILVVISLLIGFVALEPLNAGIADYADGPDNSLAATEDNPPSRDVTLAELTPFTLIAAMLLTGVGVLVAGVRGAIGSA